MKRQKRFIKGAMEERCGGVWRISPISMWELKGCDGRGNPTMIDMPT